MDAGPDPDEKVMAEPQITQNAGIRQVITVTFRTLAV